MSYSQLDLLEEERFLTSGEATWKYRILYKLLYTKKVHLEIRVPLTYFKRAEVFCDDLMRITDEEYELFPETLIDILVQDFIQELARNSTGPRAPYEYLMDKHSKTLTVAHYKDSRMEEFELYEREYESLRVLKVQIGRKEALRLEWFLNDLELEVVNHGFTVERIMEILFCYLIEIVKRGEAEKAVKKIITSIDEMN